MQPDLQPLPLPLPLPVYPTLFIAEGKKVEEKGREGEKRVEERCEGGEGEREEEGKDVEEDVKHVPRVYNFSVPIVVYNENCTINKN